MESDKSKISFSALKKMKLAQLRTLAKENKLKKYSKLKKDELIEMIKEHIMDDETESLSRCCALVYEDNDLVTCGIKSTEKYCSVHRERYKLEKPEDCAVCLCELNEKVIPLNCGHWFHKECIIPTNIHSCPMCRGCMDKMDIEYIFGSKHISKNKYSVNDVIDYVEFVNTNNNNTCDCILCRTRTSTLNINHHERTLLLDILIYIIHFRLNTNEIEDEDIDIKIESMSEQIISTDENQVALFRLSRLDMRRLLVRAKTLNRSIFNFINVEYYNDMRQLFNVIDNLKSQYFQ